MRYIWPNKCLKIHFMPIFRIWYIPKCLQGLNNTNLIYTYISYTIKSKLLFWIVLMLKRFSLYVGRILGSFKQMLSIKKAKNSRKCPEINIFISKYFWKTIQIIAKFSENRCFKVDKWSIYCNIEFDHSKTKFWNIWDQLSYVRYQIWAQIHVFKPKLTHK